MLVPQMRISKHIKLYCKVCIAVARSNAVDVPVLFSTFLSACQMQ